MGVNYSKSTVTNVMALKNSTSVNTVQNCFNLQHTEVGRTTVNIFNFICKDTINIGSVFVTAQATCEQSVDIAVLTKNVLDQQATAEAAATGLALNILNYASANSNNLIELQNNIAAQVYASCANTQDTFIGERVANINGVQGGANCNVLSIGLSAQMGCTNNAIIDLTTDNDLSQIAKAKATAGLDLSQLILILMLLFGGGLLIALLGIVMKIVLKGGSQAKAPEPSIGALKGKLLGLQRKVAAKAAKTAREAAKEAAAALAAQSVPLPRAPSALPAAAATSPLAAATSPLAAAATSPLAAATSPLAQPAVSTVAPRA
jgi:hypothetical protein